MADRMRKFDRGMSHTSPTTETIIMQILKTAVIALSLASPLAALAESNAMPGFDQRQAKQERHIAQGVQSGALTQREAVRLERGQQGLQLQEDRAKADGVVTRQERAHLQHAEDVQSRRIYAEKHDRQHDYNHDGRIDRPARPRP
jgi:hypothetical protein